MNEHTFWQTPFGMMVAGWIISTIIALPVLSWKLANVYNRLKDVEDDTTKISFTLGVHSTKLQNLRDATLMSTLVVDEKFINPHPHPKLRKAIRTLIDWEKQNPPETDPEYVTD